MKGETYIPFKSAINFQGNSRDQNVSLRYLYNNNENGIIFKFDRYNPLYIYPYQLFSKHGTQVALNPQFSGGSERIIWHISSILTQIDKFWQLFENALKNDQDLFVWIIVYLTRYCFSSHKKQEIKYLFKYKYVS